MNSNLTTEEPKSTAIFSNEVYDRLKWVAQIFLPALAALYFGLSEVWGLPYGIEIVGTITVVDLFLGTILGLSNRSYNQSEAKYDGTMVALPSGDNKVTYTFDVGTTPVDELRNKRELLFKVDDLTEVPNQRSQN